MKASKGTSSNQQHLGMVMTYTFAPTPTILMEVILTLGIVMMHQVLALLENLKRQGNIWLENIDLELRKLRFSKLLK
jgi:hypothetical protein